MEWGVPEDIGKRRLTHAETGLLFLMTTLFDVTQICMVCQREAARGWRLSATPDTQLTSPDTSLSIYHETHSLTHSTVQEKVFQKSADKRMWRRPRIQNEESQALPGSVTSRLWELAQD